MTDQNPRLEEGVPDDVAILDWTKFEPAAVAVPETCPYTKAELEAMVDRAIKIHQRGDPTKAMELYREVLIYDRDNTRAFYFAAVALSQVNDEEDKVLALMREAARKLPNTPEVHYNLGILLHRMGQEENAKQEFEASLRLEPKQVEARMSLAGAHLNLGDPEGGRRLLKETAASQVAKPDAVYSRAFARMTLGDYLGGLTDYDARWKTSSFLVENRRDFGKARFWNGKPIPGKVLYVHTEQGAGDVIMLSRFLERVAARSQAKLVTLEVGESLVDLLGQLRGVDYVVPSNTPLPDETSVDKVNYYLPMMNVLRMTGFYKLAPEQVPSAAGWLRPVPGFEVELPTVSQPDKPFATMGPGLLKVGVSWAGSKAHKNDRYRSIIWRQFRDELIRKLPKNRIVFYSLQVGDRAKDFDDRAEEHDFNGFDLTDRMTTFAHSASVVSQMDLLVCVDTATVHLAGSLIDGPAVIMLTPAAPDWRWGLTGATTPWYDRFTLVRQTRADDWSTPLAEAVRLIEARLTT